MVGAVGARACEFGVFGVGAPPCGRLCAGAGRAARPCAGGRSEVGAGQLLAALRMYIQTLPNPRARALAPNACGRLHARHEPPAGWRAAASRSRARAAAHLALRQLASRAWRRCRKPAFPCRVRVLRGLLLATAPERHFVETRRSVLDTGGDITGALSYGLRRTRLPYKRSCWAQFRHRRCVTRCTAPAPASLRLTLDTVRATTVQCKHSQSADGGERVCCGGAKWREPCRIGVRAGAQHSGGGRLCAGRNEDDQ